MCEIAVQDLTLFYTINFGLDTPIGALAANLSLHPLTLTSLSTRWQPREHHVGYVWRRGRMRLGSRYEGTVHVEEVMQASLICHAPSIMRNKRQNGYGTLGME